MRVLVNLAHAGRRITHNDQQLSTSFSISVSKYYFNSEAPSSILFIAE